MNNPLSARRIFIVEDDAATRSALVDKIDVSSHHQVVGAVGMLAEARQWLSSSRADVLLVDLELPDGNGIDLIGEQARANQQLPILVISVFGDEQRVVRAISAGAQGYLLKDDEGEEIVHVIDRLLAGESPISPRIAAHLISCFRERIPGEPASQPLSDRELEVLKLARKGLSYKETAALMGVSVNTVGTYTKRIYAKLSVSSREEAIFEAQQLGLMRETPE